MDIRERIIESGVCPLSEGADLPILVTGLGRSGTTAVHRVLAALGPKHFYAPESMNAEDEMTDSARGRNAIEPLDLYNDRCDQFGSDWCTKVPFLIAENILSLGFRFVVVVRDPVAWGLRDIKEGIGKSLVSLLNTHARLHTRMVSRLENESVCFVSYEKLLTSPVATIEALADWLGLEISSRQIHSAVGEVRLHDVRYLLDPALVDKVGKT